MPAHDVKLLIAATGGVIRVDGRDLSNAVRKVTLEDVPLDMPRLTLEVLTHEVEIDGEATVTVPDATRAALVALGWTPPADAFADGPRPRRFRLVRDVDVTGVTGTGIVADGVLWPDRTATIRWRGDMPSTVNWGDIAHAMRVHGHGGATRAEWLDPIEVVDTDSAQAWVEGSDY